MTVAELDAALAALHRPGAVLLTTRDWNAIMAPRPMHVRKSDGQLEPWTYRDVKVWVVFDRVSEVLSVGQARREGLL